MKKLLVLSLILVSFVSYGQQRKVMTTTNQKIYFSNSKINTITYGDSSMIVAVLRYRGRIVDMTQIKDSRFGNGYNEIEFGFKSKLIDPQDIVILVSKYGFDLYEGYMSITYRSYSNKLPNFIDISLSKMNVSNKNFSNNSTIISEVDEEDEFNVVNKIKPQTDVMIPAEFPGGQGALDKYIDRNINKLNIPEGTERKVIVSFMVGTDGKPYNISTENNPGYGMSEESIRLIKSGPSWKPAVQNGRLVPYQCSFPINFK